MRIKFVWKKTGDLSPLDRQTADWRRLLASAKRRGRGQAKEGGRVGPTKVCSFYVSFAPTGMPMVRSLSASVLAVICLSVPPYFYCEFISDIRITS
ncbi:hypothetical protein QQP08_003556 [Theobroma cacao]|uniref:Uncharacterized protein n=1 Tax=Theobroma cacao TaxID=3641 RepID=A0A061DIF4_THECC|nr:Uncharacterized protein TCM_000765 [Theobroma cacao]WRX11069.1 hypothetical protein QQP08_003556 [Theobroma cacao]